MSPALYKTGPNLSKSLHSSFKSRHNERIHLKRKQYAIIYFRDALLSSPWSKSRMSDTRLSGVAGFPAILSFAFTASQIIFGIKVFEKQRIYNGPLDNTGLCSKNHIPHILLGQCHSFEESFSHR